MDGSRSATSRFFAMAIFATIVIIGAAGVFGFSRMAGP
jgi:hypothetical protein